MKLLAEDMRCLDAHAHLGNMGFDHRPDVAIRHYEVGVAIGALSLGAEFEGVLAWGLIDNRPFLRCLNGAGLCSWRLGDRRAAKAAFRKLLRLNPTDNQGARSNLAAIEAGRPWEECRQNNGADLVVVRAGLCTIDEFLTLLSNNISTLQGSPGRLKQTLEQASSDVWNSGTSGVGRDPENLVSYYAKGPVV